MKTKLADSSGRGMGCCQHRTLGFTLTEVMVASAILTMVLAGVLVSHLFGMRMFQLTKAKLGASDEARLAISKIVDEIRSAKLLRVGDGDLSSFTETPLGSEQKGRALQIYATTNTNFFVRYFWDSSDKKLKRTTNGSTAVFVVANAISNAVIFRSEDYLGRVLTNNQNNRVIGLNLEFYQIAYPVVNIGPGGLFDYYRLSTRITRRALE